jgi:hypothetical protein
MFTLLGIAAICGGQSPNKADYWGDIDGVQVNHGLDYTTILKSIVNTRNTVSSNKSFAI